MELGCVHHRVMRGMKNSAELLGRTKAKAANVERRAAQIHAESIDAERIEKCHLISSSKKKQRLFHVRGVTERRRNPRRIRLHCIKPPPVKSVWILKFVVKC